MFNQKFTPYICGFLPVGGGQTIWSAPPPLTPPGHEYMTAIIFILFYFVSRLQLIPYIIVFNLNLATNLLNRFLRRYLSLKTHMS